MVMSSGISTVWLFVHCSRTHWSFKKCWFLRRKEIWRTRSKTHIWRRVRESNPGHIGLKRVLSPLRHPCVPNILTRTKFWLTSPLVTAWLTHDSLRFQALLCLQRKVPAFYPPLASYLPTYLPTYLLTYLAGWLPAYRPGNEYTTDFELSFSANGT